MRSENVDRTFLDWLGAESRHTRTLRLAPGETAFRQGDEVCSVFLVDSGRVRLIRNLEDGSAVALHTATAGETFAEASISAIHYHCDAVAETPATVKSFPIDSLRQRLSHDPAAGLALSMVLAGQVRALRARLELRNIRSATKRLLAWLQMNATGMPSGVQLEQPWTEVATEIGLSREALYRALAQLSRSGAIRREGDRTVLLPTNTCLTSLK